MSAALLACAACAAPPDEASPDAGTNAARSVAEKRLEVKLALADRTLTVMVRDGETPVMTDAWLYTLHDGSLVPLAAFADPDSKRKHRALMMPCTLAGKPSGLTPCDDGVLNGFMTDAVRDALVAGTQDRRSAIDGTVAVTLDAPPTEPVVVVVAREDQRYAGAAAIAPDGSAAEVPAGVGAPETYVARTFAKDVEPILRAQCIACHKPGLTAGEFPIDSYENTLSFNFAFHEEVEKCEDATPGDEPAVAACVGKITKTEYMVDPGNPSISPLLRRTRPDEEKSVSATGARWYGTRTGARFDDTGDRRMPSTNVSERLDDDVPVATWFDEHPEQFQILWDWVAQGAKP